MGGCYDYQELDDLEIVSSIIVDYVGGEYVVNVEVLDTKESAKNGSYILYGSGKSLEEAMSNVYFDSAKTPYYSHMNALILSKDVCAQGLDEFLDYLLRDAEIRKDFYVFVAEDIEQITSYEPESQESIGAIAKKSAEKNMTNNGYYKTSNFREIIYHYLRDNNYMLGSLSVEEDTITLDKTYVFLDNKLAFDVDRSVALFENILYGQNDTFLVQDNYAYEIHEYGLERQIKEDEIVITFKGNARLSNMDGADAFDKDELKKLEEELNDYFKKMLSDIIDYSMARDEDIFNFGYFYYLYYPKLANSDSWKNLNYKIDSEITISEKGLLLDAIGGNL